MITDSLLIELGTEELPPKTLKKLSDAFSSELLNGLADAELISERQRAAASAFATPRRLALLVPNVSVGQPDQTADRRGPAVQAAFDQEGNATPAARGFAQSCGVDVADLQRLKTDKGEWLSFTLKQPGKTIADLLPTIIEQAIKRLPIAKRMRWADGDAEFVRPVHWLIVMHGSAIIPAQVLGIQAGNTSRGHRFHGEGLINIEHPDQYQQALFEQGSVVADFTQRQSQIKDQIAALTADTGGHVEDDQSLLDEVTGLVELPSALLGEFDAAFLEIPQQCLISSMRDHQKYFHVVDANGKLLPKFITVSNIQSKDPARVQAGNERVLRARLSDAQFFWETDKKHRLETRVAKLENVLFHIKLGSVLDKSKRIQILASEIAQQIGADPEIAKRGALLCKADLVSDMVNEFDELQGIMGHYYADLDGEQARIGECIEQHYWPKFAGDKLPQSAEAQAVALADKLDTLVGIFAAGEIPTGDKDPYALRRAALSILRILIEGHLSLRLSELVALSAKTFSEHQSMSIPLETQTQISNFVRGRLTAYYQSQDIGTIEINAVMACEPDSPLDFEQRLKAVNAFSQASEASDLAAANKRIGNILKKQTETIDQQVNSNKLVEPQEKALYAAIESIQDDCLVLFDQGNYTEGLQKLASLRSPVDDFFEHVMVMSDDAELKNNRLALLKQLHQLFLRVADISLLQS